MTVVLDKSWVLENQKKVETPLDYLAKAKGALQTLRVAQRVSQLSSAIGLAAGVSPSADKRAFEQNLGIGVGALGLVRLPSVTSTVIKSLGALSDPSDGVCLQRKAAKAVRDTADAISAYGYALNFLKFNPLIRVVAQVADFVSDVFDLPLAYSDYQTAQQLEGRATGIVKQTLDHAKNYYLLTVAKIVTSVAGLFLGLAFAGTGAAATIGLIALSLTTILLSIDRDFHENLSRYKVIKFDHPVVV